MKYSEDTTSLSPRLLRKELFKENYSTGKFAVGLLVKQMFS